MNPVQHRTTKGEKVRILAGLTIFEECTRRELAEVAEISVDATMREGAVLTREGQVGGLVFVIVEGSAEVLRGNRVVATLGPGDVVGELSLIDGGPRSALVRASAPIRVLQIDVKDFRRLVDRSPHFVRNLLRALARRIRDADGHIPLPRRRPTAAGGPRRQAP